jgi:DNA topoisomerase-3
VTCDFKTGKIILQQPVAPEEVIKLLTTGKTSLLENFVSNKTRRKFKAFLAYDAKEGKVSFEFEPRASKFPPKPGAAGATGAAAKKAAPKPGTKAAAKSAAKKAAA